MRILLCCDRLTGGTVDRVIRTLANDLLLQGHEVSILCTQFVANEAIAEVTYWGHRLWWINNLIEHLERIPMVGPSLRAMAYIAYLLVQERLYAWELTRAIEADLPDMVHFHAFCGGKAYTIPRNYYIPSVLTVHNGWIVCPSELLLKSGRSMCDALCVRDKMPGTSCLTHRCIRKPVWRSIRRQRFQRLYQEHHLAYLDVVTTTSESLLEHIQNSQQIKPSQALYQPSPLTTGEYSRLMSQTPEPVRQPTYFLALGNWREHKGFLFLLKVFKVLPHIPLKLVGKGPDKDKLQEFLEDHQMAHVELIDWQNQAAVDALYKGCYGVIIPTLGYEAMASVILEGFSYAKPVIAANVGGIPEWIRHEYTGLLFERARLKSLKNTIEAVWTNPTWAQQLGENGFNWLKFKFQSDAQRKQWIDIYARAQTHHTVVNPRVRKPLQERRGMRRATQLW